MPRVSNTHQGPTLARIRLPPERRPAAGAAITAYDPAFDRHDRTLDAARAVARQIAGGIRPQPTSATG